MIAAWNDPATAAGALGDAAVQAFETTFNQLKNGAARREQQNAELLEKHRNKEISYDAYLDGVRANAQAATAEALLIADLAAAAQTGGAALIRRLNRIHFGDIDGPGGAAVVTPDGARLTPPREDPDFSAGAKGDHWSPMASKPRSGPRRIEWEKAETEFGSFRAKDNSKFTARWFEIPPDVFKNRWESEPGFALFIKENLRRSQGRDRAQAKAARKTHGLSSSGGLHEYFVLDSIPTLRKLGFGPGEIADLEARVPTKGLMFRLHEKSEVFVAHGSGQDGPAHKGLSRMLDDADGRPQVRMQVLKWADIWLPRGREQLPPAFHDPQHPFWTSKRR